jgi:catechol 2,3-dioxygenase-like lactoylglutathione lyase family enzyme
MQTLGKLSLALAALGLCVLFGVPLAEASDDGFAIMKRVEAGMQTAGEDLTVRMDLLSSDGRSESRTFRLLSRAVEGKPAQSLIRFEAPGNIAGTALLIVRRPSGQQDSWLYVPALDQVRRIAPADRSESFVQSEFTIEDLSVSVDNELRSYKILGQVPCGERTCIQVEDRPRTDAAAKASGYGRVVLYVDTELSVTHRVDFYDKDEGLLKVLQADGLVQVSDGWRFDRATITNVQTGRTTIMSVLQRKSGTKLDDSVFSPSSLDSW